MTHSRFLLFAVAILSLSACASSPTIESEVTGTGSSADTTTYTNPVEPNAQVKDLKHGAETGLSICALSGENGTLANGVATAYYFEDKGSIVGIQLNVAAAEEGSVYVAWIQDSAKKQIKIGTLENTGNDVRHSVRFDTEKDLRMYKTVIITKQKTGADSVPGEIIATGILKDTKR